MSLTRINKASVRSLLFGGVALALSSLSCGREPTGPGGSGMVPSKAIAFATEFPAAFPAYQAAGGSGVAFSTVRIVLSRLDRMIALDTTITFPDSASELQLTLNVPLPPSASNSGVPLVLNLDYVSADGVVLFHGGPVTVTAFPMTSDSTPPPPSEVTIPIKWVGPGAGATKVVISPDPIYADSGAAFTVAAQAQDTAGRVIPGTPIAFRVVDANVAIINAATGVGTAGGARASTLVIAQLMGGQADTATLMVVKPPAEIIMAGGEAQTGAVGQNLAQPVMVIVFSTDTLPSPGVAVTFAAQNGGTAGATTVTTGPSGIAQTTWKLGPTAGAQTLTATVAGLTGSPVTFTATATSTGAGPATHLAFTSQPVGGLPTVAMPAMVVTAQDAANATATGFSGNVTLAFGANPAAGTLSGTLTATAVAGVATFGNVKIDKVGTGYTLVASASGLTSATSSTFDIANSTVATTTVTPKLDTLSAINQKFTLSAQALDAAGKPAIGRYTWVSRVPGVATVDTAGVVKAVTNGTTWVIATELGGTKDSAQIVVAQKLGSIKVAPNPRTIYLGASYQFTASAADGLGTPLGTQPTFTWSTASGAIATVDATGRATATGIGGTQVQATAGGVTGVAAVTVRSQITRIVVSRDSASFVKTSSDTFTVAALAATRSYVATARDTLDNAMTGVTFAWASTNGAVATLDSTGSATARAKALANGVTAIRASAEGITGAAQLTVQQALVSIDLSPATASVAPTGKTRLIARGKDANGYFIPGGTFTFASAQPANATVDAAGVVTGVAIGPASITASNASGTITSNTAAITVGGTVPPVITFGRDTLAVGRAGTASIPVYLSTPYALGALTVNLAVRDTFAFFSPTTVSIPAGQTSANATLNGHNAGTTSVYAVDGTGAGYAGDTAVLAVQANVKLTTTSYSLNVTDSKATQVLLSDPSPAGGTYVTFSLGATGMVSVSPDPAFIPAGQLAGDIILTGIGANPSGTTITPAATGVSGTASTVYTYAAVLSGSTRVRVGVGQFEPNQYVGAPTYFNSPLAVTLNSTDSTKVLVQPSVTIPVNNYYAYFPITGLAPGSAVVTASAPGWTPLADTVTVTTPKVGVCCASTYNTTSPQFGLTVYAQDSVSTAHNRTDPLVVSVVSTDPSVLKVLTPTVTIPAGQSYYSGSANLVPGGAGGQARIIATASGHNPDSTSLYTVNGPKLQFSWTTARIGAGQQEQSVYVYAPDYVTGTPLVVTLANKDSSILGAPTTITIPVGTYYAFIPVRGKATGLDSLFATATGYTPDTASYIVTSPRLSLSAGGTLNNFAPPSAFTVFAADSVLTTHPVTSPVVVTYTSTDPSVITVTGADTIQAGIAYTNHAVVTPVGIGTARIIATAPGYAPDSDSYTVQTPKLSLSWNTSLVGRRQYDVNRYVQVPSNVASPLTVTLTQTNAAVDSLSQTTITIGTGTYYTYFNAAGVATGVDTVVASATGYLPDTAVVIVTTPKLVASGLPPTATTTSPPSAVAVYTADSVGTQHLTLDAVIVRSTSSNNAVLQPTAPGFQINPGTNYSQPQVAYAGAGTASVIYSDSLGTGYLPDTTNSVTVTGPSLSLTGTVVLGTRQNNGASGSYVYVPNAITGAPLVVSLASSDPTVASVPSTVTIPVGQTYAYFQVTAQDAKGTIQVTATATGYGSANTSVQVTAAKFYMTPTLALNTTSPAQVITVMATDANNNWHYTNEDVIVTLTSSLPTVGVVDSVAVTIPANQYYTNAARFTPLTVGTTTLTAHDARPAGYAYTDATESVAVSLPTLSLNLGTTALGIGQYSTATVSIPDATLAVTANLAHLSSATTSAASVSITSGASYVQTKIVGATAGKDTITASALGFNSSAKAGVEVTDGLLGPISNWPASLAQGDSAFVTIYARDINQNVHYVNTATTLTLTPAGQIQFVNGGANSVVITSAVIPADQQYVQLYVKALTGTGSGSATISATNYTTYPTPSVIVP